MTNLKRVLSLALAAVMLMGMMVIGAGAANVEYTDAESIENAEAVTVLTALDVLGGYPDGSFKPDKAITRAEAVTLVNAVLGREPHEDHLLSRMVTWPDNPKSAWYYEDIQEATNSHDYRWSNSKSYEIWTELLENRD